MTDEQVEAACRAACDFNGFPPDEIIRSLGGETLPRWKVYQGTIRAAIEAYEAVKGGDIYKHRNGHDYRVVGFCTIEATMTPATLYRSTELPDGTVWVRPTAEFNDGRFTLMAPGGTKSGTSITVSDEKKTETPNETWPYRTFQRF